VASLTDDNEAGGNLDKRNIWLIGVGHTRNKGRAAAVSSGKEFPGLRVSDVETLSLQKSAKNRNKNTELASLKQLYFYS
jgi:hypothetical protein